MSRIILTYGLTAIILFIAGFFISGSIDISMYDTYYVISHTVLINMIAMLFVVFAVTTWGIEKMSRRLSSTLNWLHYGITTTSFVIIAVLTLSITSQTKTVEDYSVLNDLAEHEAEMSINEWLAIILVVFIVSQLLFLINIIRAFLVKRKSS